MPDFQSAIEEHIKRCEYCRAVESGDTEWDEDFAGLTREHKDDLQLEHVLEAAEQAFDDYQNRLVDQSREEEY